MISNSKIFSFNLKFAALITSKKYPLSRYSKKHSEIKDGMRLYENYLETCCCVPVFDYLDLRR